MPCSLTTTMVTNRVEQEPSFPLPENRLANHAYVSGLVGAITVLGLGYLGAVGTVLNRGWVISAVTITETPAQSAAFVLVICVVVMFIPELLSRLLVERSLFPIAAILKRRELSKFLIECMLNFVFDLLALYIAITFYRVTSEYGFHRNDEYYRPWFVILDLIWKYYLILGLPYVVATRALQYDPLADRKMPSYLLLKSLVWLIPKIENISFIANHNLFGIQNDEGFHRFTSGDGIVLRGILVKLFFLPIMSVFFMMHFRNLLNDWNYLTTNIKTTSVWEFMSVRDFYNVSITFLMSVDTALAWCGYAVSSRWVKNMNVSVEPTFFGWAVALLSYPPFQRTYGYYFTIPDEFGFFAIPNQFVVAVCAITSIVCYVIYVWATVMFGLRFSNLTHRGLFKNGPYRIVRHPAYSAKNIAWWIAIVPQIAYSAYSGSTSTFLADVVGLVGLTILYYYRAMTEERHLERDPEYRDYQARVRYRFIPGII